MIIVDTGFWLALIDEKDSYHKSAKHTLKQYGKTEELITTWPVVSETCHLLLKRKGVTIQVNFLQSLNNGFFTIFELKPDHTPRIVQLMEKYADLPMDLADASLVILAENLGHGRIFSVDHRDFNTYRWKENHPFENLLIKIST